ncbi:MAG: hypothetical protein RL653_4546, partial [Pseudomonadota bacterium]
MSARMLLVGLFALSLDALGQTAGALEGKKIAVFDFKVLQGAKVQSPELLSDECRGSVANETRGEGALVITRENMLEILKLTGGKCKEGECEVETARNLGVDLFVAGSVTQLDGELMLSLMAYETRSGQLLQQKLISAAREKALLDLVRPATAELVRDAFGLGRGRGRRRQGPAGPNGKIAVSNDFTVEDDDTVACTFESTPPGAVVRLDGTLLCSATPCSKPVPRGNHDVTMELVDYDEARAPFKATQNQQKISLTLQPTFGILTVKVQPPGIKFTLDGKAVEGEVDKRRLPYGSHEVLVEDPCFEATGERFSLARGESRTLQVEAVPRLAALKVQSVDGKGNVVDAEVWAGETKVGPTWKVHKLPLCSTALEVRNSLGDQLPIKPNLQERQQTVTNVLIVNPLDDPMTGLAPEVRAERRRRAWEQLASPYQVRAGLATGGAAVVGAATVGVGLAWWLESARRDEAALRYGSAGTDFDALYG